MTALKPLETRLVRGVPSERYPLNKRCSHPECTEDAVDPHHVFPRSQIVGDSWFVAISFKGTQDELNKQEDLSGLDFSRFGGDQSEWTSIIPHVTGLCRKHHDDIEQHRAWVKLEDAVFQWYIRQSVGNPDADYEDVGPSDEWVFLGPLNPQPGSVEGKAKRKKYQGEERRQRKTISLRVPADSGEDGAALLDELIDQLEERINPGKHRPPYHTLVDALNFTVLNAGSDDF